MKLNLTERDQQILGVVTSSTAQPTSNVYMYCRSEFSGISQITGFFYRGKYTF
jgi:hypothetical protein